MILSGESGWEINHQELGFVRAASAVSGLPSGSDIPEGQGTPQAWSHFHIILNHFPSIGLVIGLFFFVVSLVMDNTGMKRASLVVFTICGILGVPTYVTGASSMWALTDPPMDNISQAAINAHRDMALWTLFALAATGVSAWIELWRFRYIGRFSARALYIVLGFAIVTLGLIAETGHRGGQINHPEIRTEASPTDPDAFLSPAIELAINNVQWFVPWQTLHFFGYCLIFGTVAAVVLRVFGFWKYMPFSAVHRILPLGVMGVVMNVFTGMLMLLADTFRYVNSGAFPPKMAFIVIGAMRRDLFLAVREAVEHQGGRGSADDRQMGRGHHLARLGRGDRGRPAHTLRVTRKDFPWIATSIIISVTTIVLSLLALGIIGSVMYCLNREVDKTNR